MINNRIAIMAKERRAIPRAVSDAVLREFNHRCAMCDDKPQLHHIDENPSNNDPLNLIPLCPNHHLTDQHDASSAIPQARLRLFRRHKHPLILAPQFNSIFKRMAFLEDVKDDDDVADLGRKGAELADVVSQLPMGNFISERIATMLTFHPAPFLLILGGPPPDPKYAAQAKQEERAYLEKLRSARPQVEELIIELLDHQNWEGPGASPSLPLRR